MGKAVADIVRRVSRMQSHAKRLLITIDGPCASGKTTYGLFLLELVSEVLTTLCFTFTLLHFIIKSEKVRCFYGAV